MPLLMSFEGAHEAMTARQKNQFFFEMSAYERWVLFMEDRRDNEGLGASTIENQQKAMRLVAFMQQSGLGDFTAPAEPLDPAEDQTTALPAARQPVLDRGGRVPVPPVQEG